MGIESCISLAPVVANPYGLGETRPAVGTHTQGTSVFLQPIVREPLYYRLRVERPWV
jgi:hypothetical protein